MTRAECTSCKGGTPPPFYQDIKTNQNKKKCFFPTIILILGCLETNANRAPVDEEGLNYSDDVFEEATKAEGHVRWLLFLNIIIFVFQGWTMTLPTPYTTPSTGAIIITTYITSTITIVTTTTTTTTSKTTATTITTSTTTTTTTIYTTTPSTTT
jgi:hypothetical protein